MINFYLYKMKPVPLTKDLIFKMFLVSFSVYFIIKIILIILPDNNKKNYITCYDNNYNLITKKNLPILINKSEDGFSILFKQKHSDFDLLLIRRCHIKYK